MDFYLIIIALAILLCFHVLYACLKVIGYLFKIKAFSSFMKRIGKKEGVNVRKERTLFKTCFGQKGEVDYTVTANGKTYEICVLTFMSTRGRWNFEMNGKETFIECRRRPRFFYKKRAHAEMPEHALDYISEKRFARKPFTFTDVTDRYEKQIILLFPWPKCVSYTDNHYHELSSGDLLEGHTIMHTEEFSELFH